ncbi:hypothetical protein JCM16303_006785 [Sporobolomyces ruberrimus]
MDGHHLSSSSVHSATIAAESEPAAIDAPQLEWPNIHLKLLEIRERYPSWDMDNAFGPILGLLELNWTRIGFKLRRSIWRYFGQMEDKMYNSVCNFAELAKLVLSPEELCSTRTLAEYFASIDVDMAHPTTVSRLRRGKKQARRAHAKRSLCAPQAVEDTTLDEDNGVGWAQMHKLLEKLRLQQRAVVIDHAVNAIRELLEPGWEKIGTDSRILVRDYVEQLVRRHPERDKLHAQDAVKLLPSALRLLNDIRDEQHGEDLPIDLPISMLDLALKNLVKQSGQNKKFIKMRETALNDPTLHGEWIHLGRETQLRAVRKISELEALIKEAREDPKRRVRYLSTGIIDELTPKELCSEKTVQQILAEKARNDAPARLPDSRKLKAVADQPKSPAGLSKPREREVHPLVTLEVHESPKTESFALEQELPPWSCFEPTSRPAPAQVFHTLHSHSPISVHQQGEPQTPSVPFAPHTGFFPVDSSRGSLSSNTHSVHLAHSPLVPPTFAYHDDPNQMWNQHPNETWNQRGRAFIGDQGFVEHEQQAYLAPPHTYHSDPPLPLDYFHSAHPQPPYGGPSNPHEWEAPSNHPYDPFYGFE